jgi:hypothetical protein
MLAELRTRRPELLAAIREQREMSSEVEKELGDFLAEFVKTFV